jgi:hypothetical protein
MLKADLPNVLLCPKEKWAVAWIQSFLETIYKKRLVRGPTRLVLEKRVS